MLEECQDRVKNFSELLEHYYAKAVRSIHARKFFAELLATFLLVVRLETAFYCVYSLFFQTFGNGAIAQFLLSHSDNGTFLTVNIGYGVGLMIGAYVAAGVTGAHMNPAVTLAMALRGKTSWLLVHTFNLY